MTHPMQDEEAIFHAARGLTSPRERGEYLARACGGDDAMRRRIEALLSVHDNERTFGAVQFAQPGLPRCGDLIDRYKLLEPIGEGGFGVVFMAEQQHPVRRKVALKVIKPGMDSGQVIARFEAERQALALMDHPNIARVLDAGTTESGRPFFVMELVRGVPITDFCDQNQFAPRQRLELFVQVCHAVQHAHQKGIIHRDLKPGNVLVTLGDGAAVPKVIDFGIAKATGQQLTERTLFTNFAQMVGTPLYMSPEQAAMSALDVDTRSDIYSLGVLLYELLTGVTPFDRERLKQAAFDEIRRIIREEEPPRPSTRLSTMGAAASAASAHRKSDPKRLGQIIRGELDWIVMRALEKDRNRRYETASGMAADVRRYLADEPVQACPPSGAYRLRKFARRNKRSLATASVLAAALLLATGSVLRVARDRAARRHLVEGQVTSALDQATAWCHRDQLSGALSALQQAEGLLAGGRVSLHHRESVRRWRGDLDMAAEIERIRLAKTAVKGQAFDSGYGPPAYHTAFRAYGLDLDVLGVEEAAGRIRDSAIRSHLLAALDDWIVQSGPRLKKLAAVALAADPDPWRARLFKVFESADLEDLEALARDDRTVDQPPSTVLLLDHILNGADSALNTTGGVAAGVEMLRKAQQRRPDDFWINHTLGFRLMGLKPPRTGEAVGFFRVAVALRPGSAGTYVNLGSALNAQGRLDDAIAAHRRAIELKPDYASPYANLAGCLNRQKKWDEAAAACRKAIGLKPDYAEAHTMLGFALKEQGKLNDALAANLKAVDLKPGLAEAWVNLGGTYAALDHADRAAMAFGKALKLKPDLAEAHEGIGNLHMAQGKWDQAIAAFGRAVALQPNQGAAHNNLGVALQRQGKLDDALAAIGRAVGLMPDSPEAHANLAEVLWKLRRFDDAVKSFHKAIALKPGWANMHWGLGAVLLDQGKLEDAEAALRQAIALDPKLEGAHYNLGILLTIRGRAEEAITAYKNAIEANPKSAEAHCNLGHCLRDRGDLADALAALKRGHELGSRDPQWPYPSEQWVKECEKLIELHGSKKP